MHKVRTLRRREATERVDFTFLNAESGRFQTVRNRVHSAKRMASLALWLHGIQPQVMSPTSALTSAVSTCRSTSHPGKTASTWRTTTRTLSEDFGHLPQRFVASSSQHSAASTIPTLLNVGPVRSTGTGARQRLNCRFILQRWAIGARQQFCC